MSRQKCALVLTLTGTSKSSIVGAWIQHERTLGALASRLPMLELLCRVQVGLTIQPVQVHVLERLAAGRFHRHCLTVYSILATQRIPGKLIDDFTFIIHDDLIGKPLPNELPVGQCDRAAGVRYAAGRIGSVVRHAGRQSRGKTGDCGNAGGFHPGRVPDSGRPMVSSAVDPQGEDKHGWKNKEIF